MNTFYTVDYTLHNTPEKEEISGLTRLHISFTIIGMESITDIFSFLMIKTSVRYIPVCEVCKRVRI